MVRSSLPVNSPLMTTDLPMFTGPFSISRCDSLLRTGSGAGAGLTLWVVWVFWAVPAGLPPGGVGFAAPSRFHMVSLSTVRGLFCQSARVLGRWAAVGSVYAPAYPLSSPFTAEGYGEMVQFGNVGMAKFPNFHISKFPMSRAYFDHNATTPP